MSSRKDAHRCNAHLNLSALEEFCILAWSAHHLVVAKQLVVEVMIRNEVSKWRRTASHNKRGPDPLTALMASLARTSLDSSKHTFVDAFLKSLKLHMRKLSALLSQHTTELAVLERIYYINNNQHRAALFWKRVVEARRYSRRLKSCDVSFLANSLRMSFYGDPPDAR